MRATLILAVALVPVTSRYLGLRNQGNTCYMNSLLQVLHHLPQFRDSVYDLPTSVNCSSDELIALELQRVFFELEHADEHGASDVGTERLTNSFGWGPEEVLVQQDVQEFCRMLCEALQGRRAPASHLPSQGTRAQGWERCEPRASPTVPVVLATPFCRSLCSRASSPAHRPTPSQDAGVGSGGRGRRAL